MITPMIRSKDAIDTWLIDVAGNVAISISGLGLLKRIQSLIVPAFASTEQAMEWGSHLNPEQLATLLDIHRNMRMPRGPRPILSAWSTLGRSRSCSAKQPKQPHR